MSKAAQANPRARWLVHINQQVIKSNRETGRTDPPISLVPIIGGQEGEAVLVEAVFTPGHLLYMPHAPMDVGATLYMVFESEAIEVTSADHRFAVIHHPSLRRLS